MSHIDMPNNLHYANARQWDNKPMTDGQIRLLQAQATLALAYEQRTANLIAWQALGVQMNETSEPSEQAEEDIASRLGFTS